ncbi:hypothetical protein H4R24_003976 [Coemansia sp. RSA 988]|nr:hypothetical protein H4R24_003976 [Coemansia sp. RSA 988]
MKKFTVVATLALALTANASFGSLSLGLGGNLGDPLVIFFNGAAANAHVGDTGYTPPGHVSIPEPVPTTHDVYSTPPEEETVPSSTPPSDTKYDAPPVPSGAEPEETTDYATEPSTDVAIGEVPDGQKNTFNTPSGAIRFPWNYGNSDKVVPITPKSKNGGWAMSPDQMCMPNSWCPYACEPGYYSAQWDTSAKMYNGQGSMNGGLYVDGNGKITKPNPNQPFCAPGMFNAGIKNTLGQSVSACQTVYPGNEAMIIPTVVNPGGNAILNVVPKTYWLGTSAQYYVNLAGSSADQCIWGNADKPIGNWGPFIFGAGQSSDGNTYISVQYNPLYLSSGFKATDTYNVKIECESGYCNYPTGGQCKCEQGVCSVDNGCTVTLGDGAKANFVIY